MNEASGLFVVLVVCAGFTSLLTATLGIGGGVMLLGIMALVLPPQIIIPVHGIVQLGSNAGRAAMSWRHIDWRVIRDFLPGAAIGALAGSAVVVSLPPRYIYFSIAAFTLYLCWGPPLPRLALGRVGTGVAGAVTTFLTLFVGATGPLVGAFIRQQDKDRFATVATFATAMSVQHSFKATVFQMAGFDLRPWGWLMAAMICSGAAGTWLGLRLLRRFREHHFANAFRLVLSVLAVRLIWEALS
ncbi:MAG: sulfite exporter TauE/SafE family protein [Gammaproteobacteria bacterium]|jgi:uncharacterized membrane protein YfcA